MRGGVLQCRARGLDLVGVGPWKRASLAARRRSSERDERLAPQGEERGLAKAAGAKVRPRGLWVGGKRKKRQPAMVDLRGDRKYTRVGRKRISCNMPLQ
jgi:hypothetical protein